MAKKTTEEAAPRLIGTPAPAFSLPDQDNTVRSLADYKGKWLVIYFYPKDDTPSFAFTQ